MSAQPSNNAAPDLINIEVDGKPTQIRKGAMIIEAADAIGVAIPRFCYHRKLPIAANCRMCLVDVEMGGKLMPKPQPACATPVAEGMKVTTRSDKALKFQKDVMEFLLINHPLDCPICDQGGECELQDVALGYGRNLSRYTERKRTVADENLGPLVATEMTRCIQCTRCVRFTTEIAGTFELGGMSRGENLQIGTYIGRALETELSGNIIDVCPVGALTNKPARFRARAWELIAKPSISYHDALGSNLWVHTRRGEIVRSVPRDNEAINECWLADRDRYSHEGLYGEDRIRRPQIKRNGQWHEASWEEALAAAATALKQVPGSELGVLVHPATTSEEASLLQRFAQGLDTPNIDHRLRQLDLADNPGAQPFALPVAQVAQVKSALLVGSNLRHEMPLLNHRLNQAVKHGAKVYAINPADFRFNYPLAGIAVASPQAMVDALLSLAKGAVAEGASAPVALAAAIEDAASVEGDRDAIRALKAGPSVVILGELAATHPQASWLRAIARFVAEATGASYNELPIGANAVGLARLGVVPGQGGLDAQAMLAQPRQAYVLYGVEPPHDFANAPAAMAALRGAQQVVAFSAYAGPALRELAHVILPIGLLPEIDGTLVNVDGIAQAVEAGAALPGEARPGWKVLRVLGNHLQLPGFEFDDLPGLRANMAGQPVEARAALSQRGGVSGGGLTRLASWPIYRSDAVLRRAAALNAHPLNLSPAARMNAEEAHRHDLLPGAVVSVDGVTLSVSIDETLPGGTVAIDATHDDTGRLPPYGAAITLSKA
jgi:NADH-quinone oxidoreductase subunit G